MNRNGFTLIELLAVITISGILMVVAIIGTTKIIENSRRSTFATLAQTYINGVRLAVLAGELKCTNDFGETWVYPAEIPDNRHCYFNIQTEEGSVWEQQTLGIVESGGKSPWRQLDVIGTVRFYKDTVESNGAYETNYQYFIRLKDTAGHGTPDTRFVEDNNITRKSIVTSGSRAGISSGTADNPSHQPYLCYLI